MKEKFIDHKFNRASLELITVANDILREYAIQDYRLSLRQLYYQFVARDKFPEDRRWRQEKGKWIRDPNGTKNAPPNYKWLGEMITTGRLAGLIDWNMIEDRGRETNFLNHWDNPAEIVRDASRWFRTWKWEGQRNYCEVMVEKDALSGILLPVCQELDIRFTANKGYSSSSAMYETGKRLARIARASDIDEIHIFYFGDHDPSGIDMTRDIAERLSMFSRDLVNHMNVHRLALNWNQVEEWQPPENPAKEKDSRYQAYADEFGESSWELDAVEPRTLADLVRDSVMELIDQDLWDEVVAREDEMRAELVRFADEYGKPKKRWKKK